MFYYCAYDPRDFSHYWGRCEVEADSPKEAAIQLRIRRDSHYKECDEVFADDIVTYIRKVGDISERQIHCFRVDSNHNAVELPMNEVSTSSRSVNTSSCSTEPPTDDENIQKAMRYLKYNMSRLKDFCDKLDKEPTDRWPESLAKTWLIRFKVESSFAVKYFEALQSSAINFHGVLTEADKANLNRNVYSKKAVEGMNKFPGGIGTLSTEHKPFGNKITIEDAMMKLRLHTSNDKRVKRVQLDRYGKYILMKLRLKEDASPIMFNGLPSEWYGYPVIFVCKNSYK
jgi:hypothetical protein